MQEITNETIKLHDKLEKYLLTTNNSTILACALFKDDYARISLDVSTFIHYVISKTDPTGNYYQAYQEDVDHYVVEFSEELDLTNISEVFDYLVYSLEYFADRWSFERIMAFSDLWTKFVEAFWEDYDNRDEATTM